MSFLTRLRSLVIRARFMSGRDRLLHDLRVEMDAHEELLARRYMEAGMSHEAARDAAKRQLGNTTRVREDIYSMNSIEWLGAAAHDIRYAGRMLAKNPGFATAAIVTLALGIGATTAIFSVVHSVLVKPLPYVEADRIYSAEIIVPERREQIASVPASVQAYLAWRDADSEFADIAALRAWECNLTGDGEPERVGGARVSTNFFTFLGVPPAHGRGFLAHEERPAEAQVVVISDGLWRRRYGADPSMVGRWIDINGERHQVVGIASPAMLMPTGTLLHPLVPFAARVDVWKPIAPTPGELNGESWDHGVLLRLAPGGQRELGRQQLEAVFEEMVRSQLPHIQTDPILQVAPIREVYAGKIRVRLLMLMGASALLLLTACASLANLLLARAATRSAEFATRRALGAGRARIASLTLAEAVVVAFVGGAIGIALATYGVRMLTTYGPDDVRLLATTGLNVPMLLFAVTASVLTTLACGLYPAWRASRAQGGTTAPDGGRGALDGAGANRLRRTLVGAEMALATALLASAGLLLHSFVNVMQSDRGYQIENVTVAELSLFGERYLRAPARIAFYRELADNVRALPEVSAAGMISELPALSTAAGASRTILHPSDVIFQQVVLTRPVALIRAVTTGYFAASGTPLLAGRFFEREEQLTAVVSASLLPRMWPGETPHDVIGRQIRQGNTATPLITVVGVVADARPGALDREPLPVVYRPYEQWPSGPMTLVVKSPQPPAVLTAAVRQTIRTMDPNLPIVSIRTMTEVVSTAVGERQFQLLLTLLFAVLALVLGIVGIYGVVSYAVACRTREIALRMALGAERSTVMRTVFAHGMQPVVAGVLVGLVAAVALAGVLRHVLYGVSPGDPLSLAIVSAVLLSTAAIACYLPARRAARVDPIVALRVGQTASRSTAF